MQPTVILVDDDPSILYVVRLLLEDAGYRAVVCDGGQQCLQALRRGERGVILLDVMMPKMNGWETIKAIVEEHLMEGNVICMLTAKDYPDPEMEYLKEYVLDYITKPFEPEVLVSAVKQYQGYIVEAAC